LRHPTIEKAVGKYRRHRFAWLFVSLLVTIAGHSALGVLGGRRDLLEALLVLTLLVAITSAAEDRSIRVLVGLGLAFVATRVIAASFGIEGLLSVSQVLWVVAGFLVTAATVRHALLAKVVDAERILAALDAYLLVGVMFAIGYWTLDKSYPASFGAPSAIELTMDRAIYFSFVTISTLGYGDIVPLSGAARGLAILEAVSGQMYLAVLVAWLVSLFAISRDA
jgi:hypothetical protein